jgi:hypothetical protein
MDYLSYLYTPQQMSGGASFGHSTRIGNWSEDNELQQVRRPRPGPAVSLAHRISTAPVGPPARRLAAALPRHAHAPADSHRTVALGFSRVVVSEIEVSNILANMVCRA